MQEKNKIKKAWIWKITGYCYCCALKNRPRVAHSADSHFFSVATQELSYVRIEKIRHNYTLSTD